MNTKTSSHSLSLSLSRVFVDLEKKAFWMLVSLGLFAMGAYVYCICASVANIVLRKEASVEVSTLHSQVGDLETTYLQKKTALNKPYAVSLGYTDIQHTAFVSKVSSSDSKSLTLNQ